MTNGHNSGADNPLIAAHNRLPTACHRSPSVRRPCLPSWAIAGHVHARPGAVSQATSARIVTSPYWSLKARSGGALVTVRLKGMRVGIVVQLVDVPLFAFLAGDFQFLRQNHLISQGPQSDHAVNRHVAVAS